MSRLFLFCDQGKRAALIKVLEGIELRALLSERECSEQRRMLQIGRGTWRKVEELEKEGL